MATRSFPPESNEGTNAVHLEFDEFSNDVEVNIAIIGKSGSGRSSFVKAILGLNDHPKQILEGNDRSTSYSHPDHSNVKFSIHPIMDAETLISFENHLESLNTKKFDVFLFLTDDKFTKKHVKIAKNVKLVKKPLFFVRTKFDNEHHSENFDKEAIVRELRASLDKHSKVLNSRECKIYPISNRHPFEFGFLEFTKAVADALPPCKQSSCYEIPRFKELIALEPCHRLLEEKEEEQAKQDDIPDNLKKVFQEGGVMQVLRAMKRDLDQWTEVEIDLAVLGATGAGKSSFINAIRGVDDGDENAASTGVTESTIGLSAYKHPSNPKIRFWDLPGVGSPNCKDFSAYCERIRIEKYDTFLIICSRRFLDDDLKLAKKVKSMGKSFLFIRTKIDNDKRSEMRRLKSEFDENNMLEMIRNDCLSNLREAEIFCDGREQIFLISSWEQTEWDFERLKQAILHQLPDKQRDALSLSMRVTSETVLKEKIKTIKDKLWLVSFLSVLSKITLGLLGFSIYIDGNLIRSKVNDFSNLLKFPAIDSPDFQQLSDGLKKRLEKFQNKSDENIVEWLKSFDPENILDLRVTGKIILTKNPLRFVYRMLNLILDEMEEIGLAILSGCNLKTTSRRKNR